MIVTAVRTALEAELDAMGADLELQMMMLSGRVGTRARNRLHDAADVPLLAAGWTRLQPMIIKNQLDQHGVELPARLVQFSKTAGQLMYIAADRRDTIVLTVHACTEIQVLEVLGEAVLPVDPAVWETL